MRRGAGPRLGRIDPERVGLDHLEAALRGGLQFGQGAQGARVDFDGDHACGAFEQQRARQPAGAGADLDGRAVVERRRRRARCGASG